MPQRVAGHVLAVLGELHAESVIGTLVKTGEKSVDDQPGAKVEAGELRNKVRVEEPLRGFRHGRPGYERLPSTEGVVSRSFWMMSRLEIPSASALKLGMIR